MKMQMSTVKHNVILNAVKDLKEILRRFTPQNDKRTRRLILTLGVIFLVGFIFLKFVGKAKAVSWWTGGGGSWQARKQLTITNSSSASLSANATIAVTIDTSALFNAGKLRSDWADLRVLYQPIL